MSVDVLMQKIIRCPDCGDNFNEDLICQGCGRQIFREKNYYNLLPKELSTEKIAENSVFADDSPELLRFKDRIWRKLIGRLEIERFDREIIPLIPQGVFLELAGESCWASAIYKAVNPNSYVIASDISENAIMHLSIPLAHMFADLPDMFAAIDAENLPFMDATIDCIFIEAAMHHFPNPVKMLLEVKRVLKPGGRFIAIDHSVPKHFRFLFQNIADDRSKEFGIQESLISFNEWVRYFRQAGYGIDSLHPYTNTQYLRNPYFAIAGKLASVLPEKINRGLFPVGLLVIFDKPHQAQ